MGCLAESQESCVDCVKGVTWGLGLGGLRRGWDVPSLRSDRLVPVPLTTQPIAADARRSALALHWYTQEASVEPLELSNLFEAWLWLYCAGGGRVQNGSRGLFRGDPW